LGIRALSRAVDIEGGNGGLGSSDHGDAFWVEIPLRGVEADELNGPAGIEQYGGDGRVDSVFGCVLQIPHLDGDDSATAWKKMISKGRGLVRSKNGAVNENYGEGAGALRRKIDVHHLNGVRAVGNVRPGWDRSQRGVAEQMGGKQGQSGEECRVRFHEMNMAERKAATRIKIIYSRLP
jgi:hypothetical protein